MMSVTRGRWWETYDVREVRSERSVYLSPYEVRLIKIDHLFSTVLSQQNSLINSRRIPETEIRFVATSREYWSKC